MIHIYNFHLINKIINYSIRRSRQISYNIIINKRENRTLKYIHDNGHISGGNIYNTVLHRGTYPTFH